MSETEKRKIKVFIASPNDLAEERRKFRSAIDVLNIGFGDGANVEYEALGWEDTLASTGSRSQGVINQDIVSCDVFILAMHRRWGQDAPDAKPYSSYTEEEFHRALERWKKSGVPEIFVFFKRVDAASEADAGPQLSKVIKFRQHLEETRQILYRYFDSPESFLEEVDTHLRAYAKGELPKADEQRDIVVLPLDALEEVKKAKQEVLQKTAEAKQANDAAEEVRLQLEEMQLQTAEDAAKLSKEGKIEFAREKFTKLATETTNIRILYLAYEFFSRTGDLDSTLKILEKWLGLSGTENISEETAAAFGNLGIMYGTLEKIDQAEEMIRKALTIYELLDNKEEIARSYHNLGNVYQSRGELDLAEEMYHKSLVIEDAVCKKEVISVIYANLGELYQIRGELDKAKLMYNKALSVNKIIGRKEGMANVYNNIGNLYFIQGDFDYAEKMYLKSLAIDKVIGHKNGIANAFRNLGNLYQNRGELQKAEEMYEKSIVLFKEIGSLKAKDVEDLLKKLKNGRSSSDDGVEA